MTSSKDRPTSSATAGDEGPKYADRVYRSMAGVISGIALIVLVAWLGGDAVVRGSGHAPWLALAGLLFALPLVAAFTVRPAIFASDTRIRVRNPFRTITVPWAGVDAIRASYSMEMLAGGKKYQLWAIPVSLRARKRASRQTSRAQAAGDDPFAIPGGRPGSRPGMRPGARRGVPGDDGTIRAPSDQALLELREFVELHAAPDDAASRPQPEIRWAYEVIAPALAGAIVLAVLLGIGG
ncbi:PH domain-containing protein [Streptomyces sp. NPDC051976]|uniref:PH domain-containing protein n=1 Tax=Streptomyces sp. NPDC051976 TaxID=3154947 RepID=UPI0034186302